ncbi:MAG TPA: peptidoglycan DD-metalloendopeptidase family protein [Oligoflexia bacterium]|nr:peptidoglycan DD-metalloendopeptidase family protein [Oligoflexia bacterium]HMP27277.1 peptidoglycan DD-metalloendopeptidase family protein [Oligoflexia bacterium]
MQTSNLDKLRDLNGVFWERIKGLKLSPITTPRLTTKNSALIDLSGEARKLYPQEDLISLESMERFVSNQIKNTQKKYAYGGYLEKREWYCRNTNFTEVGKERYIHIGVDIWMPPATPILAPLAGVVHSFRDNNAVGDYGPTIILQHQIDSLSFYTLYGHLSKSSLNNLKQGNKIKGGEKFCEIGNPKENGAWPAHLHLQIILEVGEAKGDYPGVCGEKTLEYYSLNCPNPIYFIID